MESKDESSPEISPETATPSPLTNFQTRTTALLASSSTHRWDVVKRKPRRSRTGCKGCKDRKIKCDERRPACLNCIARGVACPYSDVSADSASIERRASPQSSRLPESKPEKLPLLELELFHNFTECTRHTLSIDQGMQELFRTSLIELGLKYDYVMRAVLAVSALHLAHNRPENRDFYTTHAIMFFQDASRSAMKPLENIDKEHNTSLFFFSVLTIYFALASGHKSDEYPFADENNYPDWAFLVSGAKSIVDEIGVDVDGPHLRPFMAWAMARVKFRAACEGCKTPWLLALQARIHASVQDEDLLSIYDHALHELDASFRSTQDPNIPRDVLDAMIWIWVESNSLIHLLKKREQGAVTIFAHFCVLLKLHEGEWFLDGWAVHLLRRSHDLLDDEHKSWIPWSLTDIDLAVAQLAEQT